jgi:hypothetical protein
LLRCLSATDHSTLTSPTSSTAHNLRPITPSYQHTYRSRIASPVAPWSDCRRGSISNSRTPAGMEGFRRLIHVLFAFWFFLHHARLADGLSLNVQSPGAWRGAQPAGQRLIIAANVKTAAASLADSCMAFYNGDQPGGTLGLLPPNAAGSFNWWESGALWGLVCRSISVDVMLTFAQMIEYW